MSIYDGVTTPTISLELLKSGSWTAVDSTHILTMNLFRGRLIPSTPVQAGTLTVVVSNRTGIYDPEYTAPSTWVVGGASILKVGLPCRIVATWQSTAYTLYYGYLESPRLDQGFNPTVTFTFSDALALLGRSIAPVLTAAQFATYTGETTSARVGRMLDYAGWSGSRAVSGYSVAMNGDPQDRSCLAIAQECALAEGGRLYASRSNAITLEGIGAKFSKPTRIAFADDGTANTITYRTITTANGIDGLFNDATISRAPLKQYRSKFDSSISAVGLRSITIGTPVQNDSSAANLSLLYARQWADTVTRITNVTFNAANLGALYPDLLSLEIGDLTWVKRHTLDGRLVTYQLAIEGYTHNFDPRAWTTQLHTSPLNPYTITV